jgi:hypothetical protein
LEGGNRAIQNRLNWLEYNEIRQLRVKGSKPNYMKRLLSCMVLILLFANACKKDGIAYGGDYGRSYLAWQDFKKTSGDSYSYQVGTSSWVGYRTETTITIKQGKVTERSFLVTMQQDIGGTTVVKEWKEDEAQLGTHEEGAALLTLDEVYTKAKENWLLKRDNAKTYFETNNNGMISLCGYAENGCQDDCLIGIRINFIKGL